MRYATYISVLLLGFIVFAGWHWLGIVEESPVIDVMASREIDLGLPVYAQFIVTQSFILHQPTKMTRLIVPIYWPSELGGLVVDLRQDDELIWRWRVSEHETGLVETSFQTAVPEKLWGEFEVVFNATEIGHEEAGNAVRLFFESDDAQYKDGHFRIADNDKQGDISLQVLEERSNRDKLVNDWQTRPLKLMSALGRWMLLSLLVLALPSAVGRMLVRAK